MTEEKLSKLTAIYHDLVGIYGEAPALSSLLYQDSCQELFDRINGLIDGLIEIFDDKDFDKYKMAPKVNQNGSMVVTAQIYRSNLSGLISRLRGQFFPEPTPTGPTTIMTQINNQQIFVELGGVLENAKNKASSEEERSFIELVKKRAGEVKSHIDFLNLVLGSAIATKVTIDQIAKLFGVN